jgi:PPK2 family polyphosphate:nucleotide phosphotransferase
VHIVAVNYDLLQSMESKRHFREKSVMSIFDQHCIEPGKKVDLRKLETDGKNLPVSREQCEQKFRAQREEMIELQERLYAEGKQKLLVVFQAMDAGGKDGTIRTVFRGVNPQGVTVTPFKKPTEDELAHDFLWRIHKAVPAAGTIGVFNRSHYEDVLVVRVHNLVPESVWKPRYEQINDFEKMLTSSGTTIIKFFLHISKKEQKQRLQERLDDPAKRWKFDRADLDKRKLWDGYRDAFEDMLEKCSVKAAPWYVIPADQNWYRDFAVCSIITETLQRMNPKYPKAEDLSDVRIED